MGNLKVLILAGGSGTRLWPLSRKYYPKQFIKLKEFDGESFFEKAYKRALKITSKENIFIITNNDYKFHCLNQSSIDEKNILVEKVAKNTLGAISLGVSKGNDDDVFVVLSSDHLMKDEEKFVGLILQNQEFAKKSLITFGITPTSPHTGYGYINIEKKGESPYKVNKFVEKPDLKTAQKYVSEGYFWNGGIFMFGKKVFLNELQKANKDYAKLVEDIDKNFEKLPDLSIDYGLLEHTSNISLIPLPIYWNDLGGFEAFKEYFESENILSQKIEIDAKNNTVINDNTNKEIAIIGVDDLIVVETKDALLISKAGESQKVKKVLEELKINKKAQSDFGLTVYRPWGSYTIVDEGVGFKSKRLSVIPGKKLSSQMHHHRSEHWVVVSGTAKVTLNDKEFLLQKGESTYIPIGTKHRLENPGKVDLHIIESQIGDYLEEDDIVRFDDDFGRV